MFSTFSLSAQVVFEESTTLKNLVSKAGEEGKLLFIDAYAEWCGPCKFMTSNIFPQKTVGEYFNKNFVCAKIDMESGEGPSIARKFNITAYPTFLILDSKGKEIARVKGSSRGGDEFIERIKQALIDATNT